MRAIAHGAFLRGELTVQLQLLQGRRLARIGVARAVLRVADFHWHVAPGLTQPSDIAGLGRYCSIAGRARPSASAASLSVS